MYEMIKTLQEYMGKPIRMQFVVLNGGQGTELAFRGKIREIHNDNRVLLFEHVKEEQKRMGVLCTELNLENVSIWGIDLLDPEYQKQAPKPNGWVATIPCPKCHEPVHIVDLKKAAEEQAEEELSEEELIDENEEGYLEEDE